MVYRVLFIAAFIVAVIAGCAVAVPSPAISRLGYSIQVGAFSHVGYAERLTSKLQDKGIEAFYFKRENGLYAVRFGDFSRWEEARMAARKLVSDHVITTYFIARPQRLAKEQLTSPRDKKEPAAKSGGRGDMGYIAARTAERFVGIPYRWGGNTVVDGMDCSGFARAVYNLCGVNIPRTSSEQYRVGRAVSEGDLEDGDLVFFGSSEDNITHVGIYIGKGRFVHAPRRGEDIRISTLNENGFSKKFMGGRRYF